MAQSENAESLQTGISCAFHNKRKKLNPNLNAFNDEDSDDLHSLTHSEFSHANIDIITLKEKGCSLAQEGNMSAAISTFKHCISLNPDLFEIYEMLAQAYLSQEKFMLAVKSCEKAILLAPSWAPGYVTLARAQREMGEIRLSLQNFQRAKVLCPNDIELIEEVADMEGIVRKAENIWSAYESKISGSKDSDEEEANRCIYNLAHRFQCG